MPYGIKVSKQGYDVKNASDDKLIIDSNKEHLKIKYVGELNMVLNASDYGYQEITFNHNLGYFPIHYVFFKYPSGITTRRICEEDLRYTFEASPTCGAYVTQTQLVCWTNCIYSDDNGKTVNFKYYIFANKIES